MKCNKCGHLNKSNMYYCVKCGNPLDQSSPIKRYKQSTIANPTNKNIFTKTQKFIIALVIIGILIVVLSAITPPDLELPSLAAPGNLSTDQPTEITDEIADKLNTTILVGAVSSKTGEKITVNAYVKDQNGNPVSGGTTSINLFNAKYSGQVENGNVNIELPELSENNYETTMVYEGNEKYNPSETKVSIAVNKVNTQLIADTTGNDTILTLKTGDNRTISGAKLIITTLDSQYEEQTDDKGQITIKPEKSGKHEVKIIYQGSDMYNPTETTIEVGHDKEETNLNTQYNEQDKTITITLTDKQKHPIQNADLEIINNYHETHEKTGVDGKVIVPLNKGENKITIKYMGNDQYQETQTTANMDIDDQTSENTTENETRNDTNNQTRNSSNETFNTTQNKTEEIRDNDANITSETRNDTKIQVENDENQTDIILLTDDNKVLGGEYIKIVLDNGTQLTEKTDSNGRIILDIDLQNIYEIKVIYEGNTRYNPMNKTIHVTH